MIAEKDYQRRKRSLKSALNSFKLEFPDTEINEKTLSILANWCYGETSMSEVKREVIEKIVNKLKE